MGSASASMIFRRMRSRILSFQEGQYAINLSVLKGQKFHARQRRNQKRAIERCGFAPIEIPVFDQIAVTPERQEHRADLARNGTVFTQRLGNRLFRSRHELRTERVKYAYEHDLVTYV